MERKKFKLDKNALFLAVFTLITALSWIFFEVYRTLNQSTITQVTAEQMKILNPQIDTQTIQALKTKSTLSETELNTAPALPLPEPENQEEMLP